MKARAWICTAAALVAAGSGVLASTDGADRPAGTPFWRVARLETPPVIDGVIRDGEYDACPAITGVITTDSVVTRQQDVVWYLGYDDENLYLAMRSPHPKGTWPIANVKENDDGTILWDDHVELQFATRGRYEAMNPGLGFYKIMANARGAYTDEWLHNGTAGSESIWSMAGEVRSTTTDDHWDLEISAPLAAFGEASLDGRSWVTQLVRADSCAGDYFAGWVRANWLDWHAFGETVFDPSAPVFRFLDRGEIRNGQADLRFEIVGTSAEPTKVTVSVRMTGPGEETVLEKTASVTVGEGESVPVRFQQKLDLPEGKSRLHVRAVSSSADGPAELLYEAWLPVVKLTEEVFDAQVRPWLERRPEAGEFKWRFAYWASYGVAESSIDVDFFGMDEATLNASAFEVAIVPAGGGETVSAQRAAIKDRQGSLRFEPGVLPEGEYLARMTLYGTDGKTVLAEREERFLRKTYAWEGHELGLEHRVFPPFTPIEVDRETLVLKPCLREITLGADGLPAAVLAEGGGKLEAILTGPVRLEADVNGATLTAADAACDIVDAAPARVRTRASFALGAVKAELEGDFQVDGWYGVTLRTAAAPGAAFDRLTLVVPLWPAADTLYVHRAVDGPAEGKGGLPEGEGILWDSGRLLKMGRNDEVWKSFVPVVFVGTGDKGMWWMAEENRDWAMSDELPAVQVVRTGEGVELRVNLLAEPASLDRERTFRFALLADPVKRIPHERKIGWGKPGYFFGDYLIFGWRKWGRSADGYYVEDEDLEALDLLMRGLDRRPDRPRLGGFSDSYMANMFKRLREDYQAGRKLVLYGSNKNMMHDLPEWATYGGEWAGRTIVNKDQPLADSRQGYNVQGSFKLTQLRHMQEVGCNWVQSQVDCFLWYHHKLLEQTPANGTWWDNASTFQIRDYDPERQEFYWKWSVFVRRELCRRLNTIGWELGKDPWWVNNMGSDWSFNQVAWHVENGFDDHTPVQVMLDHITVPEFRSLFRTRRGIVHLLAAICYAEKESPAHRTRLRNRLRAGLCLLHDIGTSAGAYRRGVNEDNRVLTDLLDRYVGFFDEEPACRFTGYWRSTPLVASGTEGVHLSVYQGKDRAVMVAVNANPDPVSAAFTPTRKLLGRDPVRMIDAETERPFANAYYYDEAGKVQRAWGEYRPGFFPIEGHGVRLIVAE